MFDQILSNEIDHAQAMIDYHRLKLVEWKNELRQLESQIETEATLIQDEFDTVAAEAWDNGNH